MTKILFVSLCPRPSGKSRHPNRRAQDPAAYLKIVVSVLPKEFVFENVADVNDDQ